MFVCKFDSKLKRRCRRANMWCLLCGSLAMCDHLLCCLLCDKNPDIGALCTDLMSCIQIKSQSRQALEDLDLVQNLHNLLFFADEISAHAVSKADMDAQETQKSSKTIRSNSSFFIYALTDLRILMYLINSSFWFCVVPTFILIGF